MGKHIVIFGIGLASVCAGALSLWALGGLVMKVVAGSATLPPLEQITVGMTALGVIIGALIITYAFGMEVSETLGLDK